MRVYGCGLVCEVGQDSVLFPAILPTGSKPELPMEKLSPTP